jgi:hypothetical protein
MTASGGDTARKPLAMSLAVSFLFVPPGQKHNSPPSSVSEDDTVKRDKCDDMDYDMD